MSKKTGTREEVWEGLAVMTSGGLRKSDLFLDAGVLKSKKVSRQASERNVGGGFLPTALSARAHPKFQVPRSRGGFIPPAISARAKAKFQVPRSRAKVGPAQERSLRFTPGPSARGALVPAGTSEAVRQASRCFLSQ